MTFNTKDRPGIDLIAHFEGKRLVAYNCPAGVPTIGYGSTAGVTLADVAAGRRITHEEAIALLERDYDSHRSALLSRCRGLESLAAHELGALVSLAFNIGVGAAAGSSAVRKAIAGDRPGAAAAILLWDKARVGGNLTVLPGLVRRRRAEARLFLTGEFIQ